MVIGVPREIKEQDFRAAMLPAGAPPLAQRGLRARIETAAGVRNGGSGINIRSGRILCEAAARAHGLPFAMPDR